MDHAALTADAIEAAAARMDDAARELRRLAGHMRKSGDLTYAGEAASVVAQLPGQCRLDLFIIRPLRSLKNEITNE